jgi:2-polyprenyl-3-methyl-5-hydroxy-6-metoxy-1,4-benzoquinol methylase
MPERHDAYRDVARHYDINGWDWYAPTYGSKLIELLRERRIAQGAAILDAGCGTGTLALMLAREGYRVTGVDLSSAMIERARAKDEAAAVDWRVGDLTGLDLGVRFDACVTTADVLNHLPSLDEWEVALARLHAHLVSGGLLFADAMTCRGLSELDQQSVQERRGVTLILAIVWEEAARRSTLKVTSFAPAAGTSLYERAQETIAEWGQPVADVVDRAKRAGFAEVERIWGHAEDPEDDTRLTLLAR